MSQADTVLEMLRERGARGVHTFEIYDVRIMNPSQRIAELEKRGHIVTSEREQPAPGRAIGARYTLVRDASSAGAGDRDTPLGGGPTDPTDTAASDWEAAGGHPTAHAVAKPKSEQDRLASASVDTPGAPKSPSGCAGQLFNTDDDPSGPRPHWQQEAA